MEKKLVAFVVLAVAVCLGSEVLLVQKFSKNAAELAADARIAYVDVNKIVSSSSQVNELKGEEAVKIQELRNFIQAAQKEVEAEKDEEKKKEILAKYEQEVTLRKNAIERDYAQKLQQIDADITAVIRATAEQQRVQAVLSKPNIIAGGKDITDAVLEALKKR